jgi:2-keto-3-deoxy-L-rhamnonate aldolase RhmA
VYTTGGLESKGGKENRHGRTQLHQVPAEGLKNADAIAAVPGVGAIFVGAGGDLHQYLGVDSNAPEVEQAFQTILKACLAHNVACGITALSGRDIARRLAEGWKMIRTNEPALAQWRGSAAAR